MNRMLRHYRCGLGRLTRTVDCFWPSANIIHNRSISFCVPRAILIEFHVITVVVFFHPKTVFYFRFIAVMMLNVASSTFVYFVFIIIIRRCNRDFSHFLLLFVAHFCLCPTDSFALFFVRVYVCVCFVWCSRVNIETKGQNIQKWKLKHVDDFCCMSFQMFRQIQKKTQKNTNNMDYGWHGARFSMRTKPNQKK